MSTAGSFVVGAIWCILKYTPPTCIGLCRAHAAREPAPSRLNGILHWQIVRFSALYNSTCSLQHNACTNQQVSERQSSELHSLG